MSDDEEAKFQEIVDNLRGDGAVRRKAVDALYVLLGGQITQFMRSAGSQAEDLMHEVFIKILRNRAAFTGNGKQFPAWVWTIARNILFDWSRKKREHVDIDDEGPPIPDNDPHVTPESLVEQRESLALATCFRQAFAAFQQAHPIRAQCLKWFALDGLPIREVALLLGREEPATRTYLYECRKKLRSYAEPCRKFIAALDGVSTVRVATVNDENTDDSTGLATR